MALAGALRLNICILNLSGKGVSSDDALNHLLNTAPQRSIILLEDIDAAVHSDPTASTTTTTGGAYRTNNVTFSGLLNALDGIAATEGGGRLLFMTTNHMDKLPHVLIRPGRVDLKEYIGWASTSQIKSMFLRFFPQQEQLANLFAERVPEDTVSMAQLQGYFMMFRDQPQSAMDHLSTLLENTHNNIRSSSSSSSSSKNAPKK